MVVRRVSAAFTALALSALACGSSLPHVPTGPPQAPDMVVVDYPPPPAKSEYQPNYPGTPCAWLDGFWDWEGRRWEWQPGGWVRPPEGCHYVEPWSGWVTSVGDGVLYFRRPRWVFSDSRTAEDGTPQACPEPVFCGDPAESYNERQRRRRARPRPTP